MTDQQQHSCLILDLSQVEREEDDNGLDIYSAPPPCVEQIGGKRVPVPRRAFLVGRGNITLYTNRGMNNHVPEPNLMRMGSAAAKQRDCNCMAQSTAFLDGKCLPYQRSQWPNFHAMAKRYYLIH
ncbi:uncharacterized protein TrAtP1_000200 [Trichoderma atroviride]|uniref:uncharacterized protein n=1 Tax=Hypocrea atroviridis TaxID=63577 RepID=UPI00331E72BE|nr:hypothetical protein TrAtP1_000200 [Trichoderma atroviride]